MSFIFLKLMARPKKERVKETNSPIKRLRWNAKLSQEQLAGKVGVAVSTIRRWEKGEAEPTMTVAQTKRFCLAVKTSFEELPSSLLPSEDKQRVESQVEAA